MVCEFALLCGDFFVGGVGKMGSSGCGMPLLRWGGVWDVVDGCEGVVGDEGNVGMWQFRCEGIYSISKSYIMGSELPYW